MSNGTCIWENACVSAPHGWGLCKRHWQAAKRAGTLAHYQAAVTDDRRCVHCGDPIPTLARMRATYCSKRCYNAAYRISGAARPSIEKQREYSRDSQRRKRAALLAAIGERACQECGTALPLTSRLSRRFCSRACINQASLRERAFERRESHRRRHRRMRDAGSPGVLRRDWVRLVARFAGRCAYCGNRPDRLTMDHVVPIARGGRHAIGNILPACFSCNASKHADFLAAWRHGRGSARLAA